MLNFIANNKNPYTDKYKSQNNASDEKDNTFKFIANYYENTELIFRNNTIKENGEKVVFKRVF